MSGEVERPLRGRRVEESQLRVARWELSMEEAMEVPRVSMMEENQDE